MADATWVLRAEAARTLVPKIRLSVIEGPDKGKQVVSDQGTMVIGSAESADLVLSDPTVSRFHLEVKSTERGLRLKDLGSTNGTTVRHVKILEAIVGARTELLLGRTRVVLDVGGADEIALPTMTHFHGFVGSAPSVRRTIDKLAKAAATDATVLITGESGTGKELAARGVHLASRRAQGPFEIVDCGGLPPTLIESELFGHVRGAFTGATADRQGAFARANGGTIFLDELGELPLELQPKLLRVLAERQFRPVGAPQPTAVDVRIVAATNRDLRALVNAGQFRADLYYRFAVVSVELPPLRDRLEDLPMLAAALMDHLVRERSIPSRITLHAELLNSLTRHPWPGNVRELRNYLEQLLVFEEPPPLTAESNNAQADELDGLPLRNAKAILIERFERGYFERLLGATNGNVAEAARRAGVDRATVFRYLRKSKA
jgi:transcriptional regulator with PAS, ATPase and Fis domain